MMGVAHYLNPYVLHIKEKWMTKALAPKHLSFAGYRTFSSSFSDRRAGRRVMQIFDFFSFALDHPPEAKVTAGYFNIRKVSCHFLATPRVFTTFISRMHFGTWSSHVCQPMEGANTLRLSFTLNLTTFSTDG